MPQRITNIDLPLQLWNDSQESLASNENATVWRNREFGSQTIPE